MSVYRKKNGDGKEIGTYLYDFYVDGQRYWKNTGLASRAEAQVVEDNIRAVAKGEKDRETALAAIEKLLIVEKKEDLSPPLRAALLTHMGKLDGTCCDEVYQEHGTQFAQFIRFCEDHYPTEGRPKKIERLEDVDALVAQAFLKELQAGRPYQYIDDVDWPRKKQQKKKTKRRPMATGTQSKYRCTCAKVWTHNGYGKKEDNPFKQTEGIPITYAQRKRFTEKELDLMRKKPHPVLNDLLVILVMTGMRLKDACLLRWDSVDMIEGEIAYMPFKTLKKNIWAYPKITGQLRPLLERLQTEAGDSEFVLPECQRLYTGKATGQLMRAYLTGLGIKRQVFIPGRGNVTVKGFHSCRYVFVSRMATVPIPLSVVKRYVGHLEQSMTDYYTECADSAEAEKYVDRMPDF